MMLYFLILLCILFHYDNNFINIYPTPFLPRLNHWTMIVPWLVQ